MGLSVYIDIYVTNEKHKFRNFPLQKFRDNATYNQRICEEAYFIAKYEPFCYAAFTTNETTTKIQNNSNHYYYNNNRPLLDYLTIKEDT